MPSGVAAALIRLTAKRRKPAPPPPLLIELLQAPTGDTVPAYEAFPFAYRTTAGGQVANYEVWTTLSHADYMVLRDATNRAREALDPADVEPLTFERLIEVLSLHCAEILAGRIRQAATLSEICAYDAVGLSRLLAFAKDDKVSEVFVDSETSPAYVDHSEAGRCETAVTLTERERRAIETHLDTFRGYALDYSSPSLKNDISIGGARLRVSLDLPPVAVNRFSLDVRRLNLATLDLKELVTRGVLSTSAAGLLVGWLGAGGNLTIVGETGTGKTTLLNALDAELDPRLRRVYIEDAVETRELLELGYHQVKVKVDPIDRGGSRRTKESEIVKALHRSPDILILSELQSKEHSVAFFQALAAGVRGIQTFHASSVEQAVRRWTVMHQIPVDMMGDLGLLVQMSRPERLRPERYVQRICEFRVEGASSRVRELFARDRGFELKSLAGGSYPPPPPGVSQARLEALVRAGERALSHGG